MTRSPRPFPVWLSVLVGLATVVVLVLQFLEPLEDQAFHNVFSYVAVLTALLPTLAWFLLFSRRSGLARVAVLVALVGGGVAFGAFYRLEGWTGSMVPEFERRGGAAEPPDLAELEAAPSDVPGIDLSTTGPGDFPGFLGAARDGRIRGVSLARDWNANPPVELWRRPVGAGWSGFAVVNGVAVTLEQREDEQALVAYAVDDGELLWSSHWSGRFEHFLGGTGPRSTPAIADGRVVALGAHGRLRCHDGATGELLWEHDLLDEWGIAPEDEEKTIQYGRSNSPLVVEGKVIVPVGGPVAGGGAGLVAFALADGAVVWEGPPRQPSFASPVVAELLGERQVICVNEDTITGHDLEDGTLRWEHPWPGDTSADASVSQPHALDAETILISKGYPIGGGLVFRLVPGDGGEIGTEAVWRNKRALKTKLTNLVVHEGHAYGLSDGILECVAVEDGARVWREGRYGHGQILLVGELLIVLGEQGEVTLVDPRPDAPNEVLGSVEVLDGKSWNHLAFSGDVLLVRNGEEAVALRLALAE